MKISDYILGVLYAINGKLCKDEESGSRWFFIIVNTKEESEMVNQLLQRYEVDFSHEGKKNQYGKIESHFVIHDSEFVELLIQKGIYSEDPQERIKCNSQFIRGYFESKGNLIRYSEKGSEMWDIRMYGNPGDLEVIQSHLCSVLQIRKNKIQTGGSDKPRKSYRFSISNRKDIALFVDYIDLDFDISPSLFNLIQEFKVWHSVNPHRVKKVFKTFKSATQYMARELQVELKGVTGGDRTIYVYQEGQVIDELKGWRMAYDWTSRKFKEATKMNPPLVEEE